ncbi:aminotransferase class I/II-fold pyridoxal phosphate-dependent enzyme [Streptomyces sp. NPDC050658]|uniref:aminotransferase class I/II-fold pyridoxal phosphate-dependent enzyme n=1 Tax=unclassified Streptomyces TaxID=2593676 RepID=UPI003421F2B2
MKSHSTSTARPIAGAAHLAAPIDCSRNEFLHPHPIADARRWPRLRAGDICRYQSSPRLLTHLSKRFGCEPEQLRLHHGAEAALKAIFAAIARIPDATLLLPEPGWDYHGTLAHRYGIRTQQYRYLEQGDRYVLDLPDLLRRIEHLACPVPLIVSPSNPLGCRVLDDELKVLAESVAASPGYCIVDQAYAGFGAAPNLDWSIGQLLAGMPSTVLVRTMSKYYGIPGLRIGFTAADPRTHEQLGLDPDYLGFSAFSDEYAARCLDAHDDFARIAEVTVEQRHVLEAGLTAFPGFAAYRSDANFVLVRTPGPAYARWLESWGVKVRTFGSPLADRIRITVPPEAYVRLILAATESFSFRPPIASTTTLTG